MGIALNPHYISGQDHMTRAAFITLMTILFAGVGAPAGVWALDCSNGQFQGEVPYSHDESLPFDFHQPLGWEAQSTTDGQQIVTVHKPIDNHARGAISVTIDIFVALGADRHAENTENLWRQTMQVIAEVPYGDGSLTIFSPAWTTQARFLVPFEGKRFSATVNFPNAEYCLAEAVKLRDLFIEHLSPNGDTVFAGQ